MTFPVLFFPLAFLLASSSIADGTLEAAGASVLPTSRTVANSIYFGGDILTMANDTAEYAEAVAVLNGKILFVGKKSRRSCTKATRQ